MNNELKLLKSNDDISQSNLELVEEFYNFLRGVVPEGITLPRGHVPKLSDKKAFAIIWYLQEHLPVFPDYFEMCWNCKDIYDSSTEGVQWHSKGRFYCDGCAHLVP